MNRFFSKPAFWRALSLLLGVSVAGWALAQRRASSRPPSLRCPSFVRANPANHFLARADFGDPPDALRLDGNNPLVLVNRAPHHRLDSNYAPTDLVDVRTMRRTSPGLCVPPDHQCLRRDAATALQSMMSAMQRDRVPAWIDSAFRSYEIQCIVFDKWAYHEHHGFCSATAFSAIPGHSQHQLGTAIDLFTTDWVRGGQRFREGFGCSLGGRWLAEHAWEHGFVLSYPLHPDHRVPGSDCEVRDSFRGRPDPRTGYKYEPWHLRYIGTANASAYHTAWLASGPNTAHEITLEQWLRTQQSLTDVTDPPVCDGCNCTSCASLSSASNTSCPNAGLQLDSAAHPIAPTAPPVLTSARVVRVDADHIQLIATVTVPRNTLTQPPVMGPALPAPDDWLVGYSRNESFLSVRVVPSGIVHDYPPLPNTWRLAVGRATEATLPWQSALVEPERDRGINGINTRIPAGTGTLTLTLPIEGIASNTRLRVLLLHDTNRFNEQQVLVP